MGEEFMSSELTEGRAPRRPPRVRIIAYTRAFARSQNRLTAGPPRKPLSRVFSLAAKRAFDVLVAGAVLVFASPILLAVWLLVIATSKGPGLFWSERVGLHDGRFMMPKFRTLMTSAPVVPREVLHLSEQQFTPVGQLLRRMSLDELPQLFSVLKGDMSLIGPRPLLPSDPAARQRMLFPAALTVRPGITGLAQVSGRNAVTARRKARLDAFYARSLCFGIDMVLLVKTVRVVLSGHGFR